MDPVTGYRTIRTISGRKVFVKMSKEEARDRKLFALEVLLTPAAVIYIFAKVAGMI